MMISLFFFVFRISIAQIYHSQPVLYYQNPYIAASVDPSFTYGQFPSYGYNLPYQPQEIYNTLHSPYVAQTYGYYPTRYQALETPQGLGREYLAGYSNEFRDESGSLNEESRHGLNNAPISIIEHASYLSLINDKDNFQTSGCSWDLTQIKCTDVLGLCKGGCRDFAVSASATVHDCRCIPYGYAALLKLAGKK